MSTYTKRQVAAIFFAAGTLFGVVMGLASCQPSDVHDHVTTIHRN